MRSAIINTTNRMGLPLPGLERAANHGLVNYNKENKTPLSDFATRVGPESDI